MCDRFFLDTNIFVHSFDRSAPMKAQKATQLIRNALKTQKGLVSHQGVLFRPLLRLHASEALYSEASQLQAKSGLHWYDSLIVSAAIQAQCDFLYTEDLQHGQRFGSLQISNPFL